MFDCPPDIIPPWQIAGDAYCTRVRVEVNGVQTTCAASKAYMIANAARVPTSDYVSPDGGCVNGN